MGPSQGRTIRSRQAVGTAKDTCQRAVQSADMRPQISSTKRPVSFCSRSAASLERSCHRGSTLSDAPTPQVLARSSLGEFRCNKACPHIPSPGLDLTNSPWEPQISFLLRRQGARQEKVRGMQLRAAGSVSQTRKSEITCTKLSVMGFLL